MKTKTPIAKKKQKKIEQHGLTRFDNYAWLRDDNWQDFIRGKFEFSNPEVKVYLDQEASYTADQMEDTEGLQTQIYEEILSRVNENEESYPFQRNNYFYYRRTEEGKDYPILCRKRESPAGVEEIYFDVNREAEGKKLFILGAVIPNDANTYLAYCYNLTGSLERNLKVRNMSTGEDLEWTVENTTGDFFWLNNNEVLYVERADNGRGQKVFQFDIHKGPANKTLLFDKPKEQDNMFMSLSKTGDREYHIVDLSSGASSCVYVKHRDADQFSLFISGENDVEYHVDHKNGHFYISTNEGGKNNYFLMKTKNTQWGRESWEIFLEEDSERYLTNFEIYGAKIVLIYKNNRKAIQELVVKDLNHTEVIDVKMKDEAFDLSFIGAYDPDSRYVRATYQSGVRPPQDLEIDLKTGDINVLKTKQVPNFNCDNYELKREFAIAKDGEEIPLTIIHKKGLKKDGSNKAYVYGYGSYGLGMPTYFSPVIYSLIDRGFVFVVAHIRGGDDKGFEWYLKGKMKNKMNTFTDFIESCEYLIHENYTQAGQIAINGGSAGGMLMGAVTNMRPELFKCVIADVAFVDA